MKETTTAETTGSLDAAARETAADLLSEAMRGSLAPVGTSAHIPAVRPPRRVSVLGKLFGDREDRRHEEALKTTANSAESAIANATVAAGLETERGYEETIRAHADSPMALAAASTLVQIARTNFVAGTSALLSAGINHIVRKINDR
jgi:hypothetical protein